MPRITNDTPLTQEQQTLVEDNHRLAKWFAGEYYGRYRRWISQEDMIGHLHLALCHAARCFDPSRGVRFATYAIHAFWRHLCRVYQSQKTMSRRINLYTIPLSQVMPDHSRQGGMPHEMTVNDDFIEKVDWMDGVETVYNLPFIDDTDRQTLDDWFLGYSLTESGKRRGMNRRRIAELRKGIQQKLAGWEERICG